MLLFMSTAKLTARKSIQEHLLSQERRDSGCFQKALVSVLASLAEELPETTVKAWKRRFMMELKMSQQLKKKKICVRDCFFLQ